VFAQSLILDQDPKRKISLCVENGLKYEINERFKYPGREVIVKWVIF